MRITPCGAIPAPCIYGKRSQNSSAGCFCILARNGDLSRAGQFVDRIIDLKSAQNRHVFKSPLGCRVQPYLDRDTVNGFNLIRFEKKVVLRTGFEKAVCKSLPFQADDRIIRAGSNNDLARQFGIVALFICNFKRDVMCTVRKNDAACRDFAGGKVSINRLTIHIDLCSCRVKTGIVRAVRSVFCGIGSHADGIEINGVVLDGITVLIIQNQRIGDHGRIAVINNITVVQGNIVNVEGDLFCTGRRGGNDPLDERRRIVCLCRIALSVTKHARADIRSGDIIQITVDICPTGLRNLVAR